MNTNAQEVIAYYDSLKQKHSNPAVGLIFKPRLERTARHFKMSLYQVKKILSIYR